MTRDPRAPTPPTDRHRAKDRAAYARHKAKVAALRAEVEAIRPPVTTARAEDFVKLVSAGLPPLDAFRLGLSIEVTHVPEAVQQGWLDEWLSDPLVTEAANAWNHGAWEDLPEARRVEVALAHATNQMAHFLYTHAFHDVGGAELAKWGEARKTLQALLDAKSGTGQSAYDKFLAQILTDTAKAGPPQLGRPLFRDLNADLINDSGAAFSVST